MQSTVAKFLNCCSGRDCGYLVTPCAAELDSVHILAHARDLYSVLAAVSTIWFSVIQALSPRLPDKAQSLRDLEAEPCLSANRRYRAVRDRPPHVEGLYARTVPPAR